jgi:ribosomal-protein-alanine N-acetyltransferase
MLPINFHPFPLITTERLLLRQITEPDTEDVFAFRSDKRAMQFIDRPIAKTHEDALKLIRLIHDGWVNNEALTWAIAQKDSPKVIGTIGFWKIDKANHRAEIGYMLHPDFHGKGIMSEAITAIIGYGFKVIKLHSIEANINPNNEASVRLLKKNKFVKEAHYKENYYFNGKFLDSIIYSLLTPFK